MAAKEKKSFSLSVNSKGQMMKIGLSKDYGICKGTRKSDGKKCTMAIDTRYGKFCEYQPFFPTSVCWYPFLCLLSVFSVFLCSNIL